MWIPSFLIAITRVKASIVAQLDLHRTMKSRYWNAGVLVVRRTDWLMDTLRRAYRQWHIALLKGILYFNMEQDSMNEIIRAMPTDVIDQHVELKGYGGLWTLFKDVRPKTFVIHFPNCVKGRCTPEYLRFYHQAMNKTVASSSKMIDSPH